jgi:hypothetical protein
MIVAGTTVCVTTGADVTDGAELVVAARVTATPDTGR